MKLRTILKPKPMLNPCPCCGGKGKYYEGTTGDAFFPKVYSTIKVGCTCGIFTRETIWNDNDDIQEVADIWNRRVK